MNARAMRRRMCTIPQRLAADPSVTEFWKKLQGGSEFASRLEEARKGSQAERAALAVDLASRWTVEQVAATKQENNVGSTFSLRVDGATVGLLRTASWPKGPDGIKTAVLHALHCDPAMPLALAAYPLIEHARTTLTHESIGVERIMGIAALPGRCQWIVEENA